MLLQLYAKRKCVLRLHSVKEAVTRVDIAFAHHVKKLVCK
jgi:hypothetical protein